jgi:hypothetical protein
MFSLAMFKGDKGVAGSELIPIDENYAPATPVYQPVVNLKS